MRQPDPVPRTLGEIASKLGGELQGPADKTIRALRPIDHAGAEDITFIDNPKYVALLGSTQAGAVVLSREAPPLDRPAAIRVDDPYVAFAELIALFHPRERPVPGISGGAHVGEGVRLGEGVSIQPGAFIGDGVTIGDETEIHPGVYIGAGVSVGSRSILHPGVTVYPGCIIGDRVILHAGVVIGADGFGYARKRVPDSPLEPVVHQKIPQIGIVVIEDDVEIGANSTIDRATLEETRIGRGTKIDNLVMIAHNCRVGRHTIVVSQVGVSGSTTIGNYVTLAGQAGLVGHIKVGDRAIVGAQSGVTKDIPEGQAVFGSPAMPARQGKRALALLEHLPEYRSKIRELDERLRKLESDRGDTTGE